MLVVYLVDSDNDVVRLGIDESRSEYSRDLQSRYEAALIFEICVHFGSSAKRSHRAGRDGRRDNNPLGLRRRAGAGRPAQAGHF